MANSWALCIGLLAVVSCCVFLAEPTALLHATSIGLVLHNPAVAYCWNVLYGLGGLGMLIGLIWLRPDIDVAGLSCFAGATLIQTVTTFALNPPFHWLAIFTFLSLFVAAVLRIYAVISKGLN